MKKNPEHLRQRDLFFELTDYMDKFIEKPNQNKFFVIPGLRGVGKSTIIYQLYDYLLNTKNISSDRILLLDLEQLKYEKDLNITDYINVFIKQINEEYYLTDKPLFIFVDESQYDTRWDWAGKLVYDEHINVFMIFTGSNALNLSYSADAARRLKRKELYPLNFLEYLEIKYGVDLSNNLKQTLHKTILSGNIDETVKTEKEIQLKILKEIPANINHEWENYIQYGNLPLGINDNPLDIVDKTLDINDSIEKDFLLESSLNEKTRKIAFPLIKQLAMQKPGTTNNNSLANILGIDSKTVKKLLQTLENTQLIFHIESYGSSANRQRKSYEYYFLSTQIKAAYFLRNGDVTNNYREYLGILLENLIAATLYKLQMSRKDGFGVYYDSKKCGVDFIIKSLNNKPIPIEVAIGKKNKNR